MSEDREQQPIKFSWSQVQHLKKKKSISCQTNRPKDTIQLTDRRRQWADPLRGWDICTGEEQLIWLQVQQYRHSQTSAIHLLHPVWIQKHKCKNYNLCFFLFWGVACCKQQGGGRQGTSRGAAAKILPRTACSLPFRCKIFGIVNCKLFSKL